MPPDPKAPPPGPGFAAPVGYNRYYGRWHTRDQADRQRQQRQVGRLLAGVLPSDMATPILDLGCGGGYALLTLRALGYQNLLGLDRDPGLVEACRRDGLPMAEPGDAGEFLVSHPGCFGLILAFDLLEHIAIDRQIELVSAIHGALLPGGTFLCTVPNASSPIAPRWRYNDWTHTSTFTEHSLDFLLFHGGFRHIVVTGSELAPRPRLPWLPRPATLRYWLRRGCRLAHRLEAVAEFGFTEGRQIPLTPNLRGVAVKE